METVVINLEDKKEYFIDIQNQNENVSICPVCSHDRKKSKEKCFGYNASKGVGRCNHCGVILVKKQEFIKKDNVKEYKRPKFSSVSNYSDGFKKFFASRGISEEIIRELKVTEGITWMPKANKEINTIQFNYFRNGELINIKYRGAGKDFKLSKDSELIFYNIDSAINESEVIIVEGEMDCLAMVQAGYKNTISVPNGANLKTCNLEYLDNCIDVFNEDNKFILALDNDEAGNNLKNELIRRLGAENCKTVFFKDCKDANECLIKYGVQGIIDSINNKKDVPIDGVFDANNIIEDIYDFYNNGLPKGEGIGIYEHDSLIKFKEGYVTTITGIPNQGKSEYLDFILCKLNILSGWKTALYSPENHPLQLHFSKFAEKVIGKRFEGYDRISEFELKKMIDYHANNFFFINPKEDFTIDSILNAVKSLVRTKGIKAFVIDAWNKIDHHYTVSETKYISEVLDKLTIFCERNKIHLFLVAHPVKMPKDKETGQYLVPDPYSIAGSAHFFNKSANVITVYRNFEKGHTDIYIQKVKFKHWGRVGNVDFVWNSKNGRYYKGVPDDSNWLFNKIESSTEQIELETKQETVIVPNESFLSENTIDETEVNKKAWWDVD